MERIPALPSKDLAALNLDDVTMATLKAVGKRVGCTAEFSIRSKQTALSVGCTAGFSKRSKQTALSFLREKRCLDLNTAWARIWNITCSSLPFRPSAELSTSPRPPPARGGHERGYRTNYHISASTQIQRLPKTL